MEKPRLVVITTILVLLPNIVVPVQGILNSGCSNYRNLTDFDRGKDFALHSSPKCDRRLRKAWYRITGAAGKQMPTQCVPTNHCGTHAPGWLSGGLPTMDEGVVHRNVCFHWLQRCCRWSHPIRVLNCDNTFYVYELSPLPTCYLRYCGDIDLVQSASPISAFNPSLPVQPISTEAPVVHPSTVKIKGIDSVTINASKLTVEVGSRIEISCDVIGSPAKLTITWFKADKVIRKSGRTKVETRGRNSRLTIRNVSPKDQGEYRCQASTDRQTMSESVTVWVLPILDIQPRAVTKRVGEKATFKCVLVSGFRKEAEVSLVEVTNRKTEVFNRISLTTTPLRIPNGGNSYIRKFLCEIKYRRLVARSVVAELMIVTQDAPKCPEITVNGVAWSATAGGGADVKLCPNGAIGIAVRKCSRHGVWKKTNFTGCRSAEFDKLNNVMDAIMGGFESDVNPQQLLSQLANASQPAKNGSARPPQRYGGDLAVAVNILARMAEYNGKQGNVSSPEDLENFAQVASNLLESTNAKTWNDLDEAGQGRSQILVKAMDDYGLGVAATFNESTKSEVVETQNLVMRIDRISQGMLKRDESLKVSYEQSSISLPTQAFSSSHDSRVVTMVYLTLSDILVLGREKKQEHNRTFLSSSAIVSSTISPRRPEVFSVPVKVVLQNREMNFPSNASLQWKCVFWRPEESSIWNTSGCRFVPRESNASVTTCECDHLTIFAAIMDPYDLPVTQNHKESLEIISAVGCSISLVAVIITIIVSLVFWRVLKSPRAHVLLNLCAAIAATCALSILERTTRNKAGCPVVAASLHYFLLALFSWMLCEGVLHYYLLIKVFGGGVGNKVKYFYMFGWGFPAIVVTISLAVTKAHGYGSKDICWLDVNSGLIWTFIAPALLVIVINTGIFVLVIHQMMGTRYMQDKTHIGRVKAGVKASAVILPLLGITWLFGLLSFSSNTIAFKYIFAIFNSLQGLVIFIFHCVLNKQIKDAIKRKRDKTSTGMMSSIRRSKLFSSQKLQQHAEESTSTPNTQPNGAQEAYKIMENVTSEQANRASILLIKVTDDPLPEAIIRHRQTLEEKEDWLSSDSVDTKCNSMENNSSIDTQKKS